MTRASQRAFSSGELSPSLFARVDTARYQTGLRTCRNFMIQQDGGVVNRPGTRFVAEVKDSSKATILIPFVNDTSAYVIELGDQYARFHKDGAQINISAPAAWVNATAYKVGDLVSQGGVNYYATVVHTSAVGTDKPGVDSGAATKWYALTGTIYEIPTPWLTADLARIQFVQVSNVMTLVRAGYAPRELTWSSDTKWVMSGFVVSPHLSKPSSIGSSGGSAGGPTYWAITAVEDGTFEESLPGLYSVSNDVPSKTAPTTLTWGQVSRAISYNVYRAIDAGNTYGFLGTAGGVAVARVDTSWTDTNEVASSSVAGVYAAAAAQCRNPLGAITSTQRAFDGKYTAKFATTLASGAATTGLTRGRVALYYQRDTDAVRVLSGYAYVDPVGGANQTSGPTAVTAIIDVPDDGYATLQIDLVPEVNPGNGGSTCTLTVDTSAGPNNEVSWTENSVAFIDDGSTPDTAAAPPTQPSYFDSTNKYPGVVTRYQQRGMFAGSTDEPRKVWSSKVGNYKNFAYAIPLQEDDPVIFEIDTNQDSPVRHLLDLGRLLIFTSTAEFVAEGNQEGILMPNAINPRKHSYNGASFLRPLVINNRALYVQARGNSVRSIRHDDIEGSIHTNLGLFAAHLFRGKSIVSWAASLIPNSIIWAVRSDGTLLGLTYLPELDVWGWHRHDTDGLFENVCCIPGTTNSNEEDIPYLIVKRTINGATKRYVEYMPTRYYTTLGQTPFMDCAVDRDGSAGSAGTLSHLEAKSVSIHAAGVVVASPNNPAYTVRTVAGASVALGANYANVTVGLPYLSDLETLDIDTPQGGSVKHDKMLVSRVVVFLDNTSSLFIGLPKLPTTPLPLNGLQPLDTLLDPTDSTATTLGARAVIPISEWNSHGRILIRQPDPLPTTILMISPQLSDEE